jgi:hypothetical protein
MIEDTYQESRFIREFKQFIIKYYFTVGSVEKVIDFVEEVLSRDEIKQAIEYYKTAEEYYLKEDYRNGDKYKIMAYNKRMEAGYNVK